MQTEAQLGYVYVIQTIDKSLCKIGKTIRREARVSTLLKQSPVSGEVVAMIISDDYSKLEKALHERYAHKRMRGEWFKLSEDDIRYLQSLQGNDYLDHYSPPTNYKKFERVALSTDASDLLCFIKERYCSITLDDKTALEAALVRLAVSLGYPYPEVLERHNAHVLAEVQRARGREARIDRTEKKESPDQLLLVKEAILGFLAEYGKPVIHPGLVTPKIKEKNMRLWLRAMEALKKTGHIDFEIGKPEARINLNAVRNSLSRLVPKDATDTENKVCDHCGVVHNKDNPAPVNIQHARTNPSAARPHG